MLVWKACLQTFIYYRGKQPVWKWFKGIMCGIWCGQKISVWWKAKTNVTCVFMKKTIVNSVAWSSLKLLRERWSEPLFAALFMMKWIKCSINQCLVQLLINSFYFWDDCTEWENSIQNFISFFISIFNALYNYEIIHHSFLCVSFALVAFFFLAKLQFLSLVV